MPLAERARGFMVVAAGHNVSEIDIVIENGRVRAGYHVGALLEAEMIIHLIGERPGTGVALQRTGRKVS